MSIRKQTLKCHQHQWYWTSNRYNLTRWQQCACGAKRPKEETDSEINDIVRLVLPSTRP